jgi:hypothetical protein
MVLVHQVWLKLKTDDAAAVEAAFKALLALKDEVPGILEISVGTNVTSRANGCTHGLLVKLADMDALNVYIAHPAHQRVVHEVLAPLKAGDTLALDYYEFAA